MEFIGRKQEMDNLEALFGKEGASLVVLMGRRRVGKSRLVTEFAKKYAFMRFSGIAPTKATTAQSEREHFARQLSQQTSLPKISADNWEDLFALLAKNMPKGKKVILLDEISWMGSKDSDFVGLLKDAWDYNFSVNEDLVIILCGSVSAWIEEEIVNSTAFLGRPSLYIKLQELNLGDMSTLWKTRHLSAYEKLKILAVTGGVPRYLELLNFKETADYNIKKLCFTPSSPLLDEYERIFSDIFGERSVIYKKIMDSILNSSQNQAAILKSLDRDKSGTVSKYLQDLIEAGFISRDYAWDLSTGKKNKQSCYRIKDNFIRFNLNFIEPYIDKIKAGFIGKEDLSNLPGWYTTLGLQFENLVVNNVSVILDNLGIVKGDVVNLGPYVQSGNKSQAGCQIDLLIQTKSNVLYVCEIKFSRNSIPLAIVDEVKLKLGKFKRPKGMSCLPVLIHVNGVGEQVLESQFFYRVISFGDILDL